MSDYETVLNELSNLRADMKAVKKVLRKIHEHQVDPDGEKAKARAANNGFNKPQTISKELATFLGLPDGKQISRTEVTKRVSAYIKEKGLMNPNEKRQILLDDALQRLLNPPAGTIMMHTNMQKYLSPHYIKEGEVAAVVPKKKKKIVKKKVDTK